MILTITSIAPMAAAARLTIDQLATGWVVSLVVAALLVSAMGTRHRRDGSAGAPEQVTAGPLDEVRRLETRSRVACDMADGGWFEYQPATGRFVASSRAWQLLNAASSESFDRVLSHLRPDERLAARHALHVLPIDGELTARVPVCAGTDRWIDVSASVAATDPSWVVGVAVDATDAERDARACRVANRRRLHLGSDATQRIGAVCDGWLTAGRSVLVAVIEFRGLDDVGLLFGDRASADAFQQVVERCAWAQPRESHVAVLTDRHVVLAVPVIDSGDSSSDSSGRSRIIDAADESARLAASMHAVLERPVTVAGRQVRLSARIGVVVGPVDGTRFGELAARSRAVAGRATPGSGITRFAGADLEHVGLDLVVAEHVAWALSHDAITVAFQPVVDARSGRIRSVEALVRCWHPDLGDLPSEQIVATAASQGDGLRLFRTVLHRSLQALRHWCDQGLLEQVSVNIAPELLGDPRTAATVDAELAAAGLGADALVLEVTEHAAPDDLVVHADAFRARGVRLAIDDFGAGHSSVGRLIGLDVDVVKLDRSLVSGLDSDGRRERLVALANDMVHSWGGVVVAEGVETEPEARLLRDAGVDYLQGFVVCRPLAFDAMSAHLEERRDDRR